MAASYSGRLCVSFLVSVRLADVRLLDGDGLASANFACFQTERTSEMFSAGLK